MLWPPRATQLPFKTCHGFGCEGENAVLRERRGLGEGALLQGAPSGALPGHGDAEEEMLRAVSAFAAQSPVHACAGATLQGKDVLPQSPAPLWDLQPHTMSCRKAHKALAAPWSCSPGSASMRGQPDHGECVLGIRGLSARQPAFWTTGDTFLEKHTHLLSVLAPGELLPQPGTCLQEPPGQHWPNTALGNERKKVLERKTRMETFAWV